MNRFIMSNRRAGKFQSEAKLRSREALNKSFESHFARNVTIVGDQGGANEEARRTVQFEADPAEMLAKLKDLPSDVMLEPEILHHRAWTYPLSVQNLRTPSSGLSNQFRTLSDGPPVWPLSSLIGAYPQALGDGFPWPYASPLSASPQDGGGFVWPLRSPVDPGGGFVWPLGSARALDDDGPVWPLLLQQDSGASLTVPVGTGVKLRVKIKGGGTNLEGVSLELVLRGNGGINTVLYTVTSAQGEAVFSFGDFWQASVLVINPPGDYWSSIVRGPKNRSVIELMPLPKAGPVGWWHQALGIDDYDEKRGKGINIGVVDTGVGPHPNLAHVKEIGSYINGKMMSGAADVDSHGTHVCGIIGARPQKKGSRSYMGIAPGVNLACIRVFALGAGANQGDIASAIDWLSKKHRADLINLSLGSPAPSEILRDAIIDAQERGTLCLCAAGNDGGQRSVCYPAHFPETVAVSAIGLEGWGPSGSTSSMNYPLAADRYGKNGHFLGSFSNFGTEIECCAPGVGIISTVPAQKGYRAPYAALDGTSMAVPAACGALAVQLARQPSYKKLPRNLTRAHKAREILRATTQDLLLAPTYQGRGLARGE
jgi:subtilisin